MKPTIKLFFVFMLLAVLTVNLTTPVRAFDGRTGENIVIKANEVVEDDLYVTANVFVLEGTVKGDLIVFATEITINGTVEGDLMAAGQSVVINGAVTDDARIAGAALQIGKESFIGGDLVAGGASLETQKGSAVDGELVFGAGQTLLAGNVTGDVLGGTGSLELLGEFGGNMKVDVGDPEQNTGAPSPSMYMPNIKVALPVVTPGFTIDKDARIKGNLVYTQSKDIKIPPNVVSGKITRNDPVADPNRQVVPPTPAEKALKWTLDLLRMIITIIILGLLLGWLAPVFIKALMEKIQSKPSASLGWGVVAYAAFFFAILVIIVLMVIGGVFFGALTLGGVSGSIIWLGLVALIALTVGFVLVTSFLTKIVVAWLGGRIILNRFSPALAEHKVWPLMLGAIIVALAVSLPFVGWMFGLIVVLLGLGAFWLWGRELWINRKTIVTS